MTRLLIGTCRECAGTGSIPARGFEETGELAQCHLCEGTGDLDSYRLMCAYERGRKDALAGVQLALGELQLIVNQPAAMTPSRLRQAVGAGRKEPRHTVPGSPDEAGLTGSVPPIWRDDKEYA